MTKPSIDRHPKKAFLVLFFIEIWERFGYYGMASLMVLYMVERLDFTDAHTDIIWGTFSALVYSMPMLGGYLGDRVLGARRTLVLGAITLGLGYVLLSIPLTETLFPAMGFIALGNGLFKVNPNNLVSRLYEGQHSKLDILFTLYYTSLNIGSFISILLTPWIKDQTNWVITLDPLHFDSWHLAFGLSAIGLTLGLLNYGAFQHYLRPYGTASDFEKLNWRKLGLVIAASLLIAYLLSEIIRHPVLAMGVVCLFFTLMIYVFAHLLISGEKHQRKRIIACIVFTLVSAIWAIYNQQIYTSLTLFALRNVEHTLLGVHVAAAQFQDLNQFWLVLLALPLAWLYSRLQKSRNGDFSITVKYTSGIYLLATAFFLYAASGFHGTGRYRFLLVAGGGLRSPVAGRTFDQCAGFFHGHAAGAGTFPRHRHGRLVLGDGRQQLPGRRHRRSCRHPRRRHRSNDIATDLHAAFRRARHRRVGVRASDDCCCATPEQDGSHRWKPLVQGPLSL